MPWSVQTWLPGTVATPDGHSDAFAHDLAEFIAGVRAIDTRGRTFTGDNRGGHLPDHDAWMETCLRNAARGCSTCPRCGACGPRCASCPARAAT